MKTMLLIIIGIIFSTSLVVLPAYAVESFDGKASFERVPEAIIPDVPNEFEIKFHYIGEPYVLHDITPIIDVNPESAVPFVHIRTGTAEVNPSVVGRIPVTITVDKDIPNQKIFLNVSYDATGLRDIKYKSSWADSLTLNIGAKEQNTPATKFAKLGNVFELQPHQDAEFPDENLTISFLNVLEDSRCPADVMCVWQGMARLDFSVYQVLKTEVVLDTLEKYTATVFGKYQINMIDVRPHPTSTYPIKNEDYTAVLRISKIDPDVSSPLKQFKSGIIINDIQCKNDMHVLTARPNGKIACVSGPTAEKLGWKIVNPDISVKSVFEVSKDDVTFDVNYSIKGGMIKDMTFDEFSNYLLVRIDPSAVGILTIEIPRELLDAKMDYCPPIKENPPDWPFFVLLDGEEILYDEIRTDSQNRTLKIQFTNDSKKMEIIALCLT